MNATRPCSRVDEQVSLMNCRHLYCFWVVSKEGGFAHAARRLDVALTDAGQSAFSRAEEIFQLGQMIPDQVREAANGKVARLAIGMSDGISKLALHALLVPVLATPSCAADHGGGTLVSWR